MLIQGKIYSYGDDLSEAIEIRRKVFVEEQGISQEFEFDNIDPYAIHVVIYEGSKAVATGRIHFDGDTYVISKVAVLKEYRKNRYGDFVVRMLLNKAITAGAEIIYLIAQEISIGFYESIGFKSSQISYVENGARYVKMTIDSRNVSAPCRNN